MATEKETPPVAPVIVVKRIKKVSGGAHGGAWKIAFADFMTALMAFFLLMWLLGSVSQTDLQGLSEFFEQPMRVSLNEGSSIADASSVIEGGGTNLVETARAVVEKGRESKRDTEDRAKLQELKQELEAMIKSKEVLRQFKNQIVIELTELGLRIQLVDDQNRPMFRSGSAVLRPYSEEIIKNLAVVLAKVDNRLSISGHTDAVPYSGGQLGYSNWELSADRANAARRAMVRAGINTSQILRVEGLADSVPFDGQDAFAEQNRRISIVVLSKKAEDEIRASGLNTQPASSVVTE